MPDLLDSIKHDLDARLKELRPLVGEVERLEQALAALHAQSAGSSERQARRPAEARSDRRRAPRGQNRERILAVAAERPGVSVAEIASVTGIDRRTATTTVSKLKREGALVSEAGGVRLPRPGEDDSQLVEAGSSDDQASSPDGD